MIRTRVKEKLTSENVVTRILTLTILFLVVFFSVTVLSYCCLPEGFLLRRTKLTDFETSENIVLCALQIFMYNMISVVVIIAGSLIAQKKEGEKSYKTYGCVGFFVLISLNAITLGTWSFTVNTNVVPLLGRIFRTFDIVHNAGLLEMYGQLLITAAFATKYLLLAEGKKATTRKIRDIKMKKSEVFVLICGFALMLVGAFIESNAIISNATV